MARKTPPKDPETGKFVKEDIISADDAINEERQRIEDEKATEFLGEKVEKGKVAEEPVEEEVKEEKPQVKEEKKPEIDPELIKKEITEKVTKETADKITKALTGEDTATKEQKDRYQQAAEDFFAKHGRNPTWHELIPIMVEDAVKVIEERQIKKQQDEEAKKKDLEARETAQKEAFNKHIDSQLTDLKSKGKIKNEQDQRALFQKMMEVNEERVKKGQDPIYSLKEIYYEHYEPTRQPAGWNAPVSVGRGAPANSSDEEYSYSDIRGKKSFLDILMGK